MKEKKWIPAPSTMLGTGFAGMTLLRPKLQGKQDRFSRNNGPICEMLW